MKRPGKLISVSAVLVFIMTPLTASALSTGQADVFNKGIHYFNTDDLSSSLTSCSASTTTSSPDGSTNLDYAGRPILNQGELKALISNTSVYQQAAQKVGIPWQVLAVLHYREHDLSLEEPSNGDGLYQIVKNSYPTSGTATRAEFLQQSLDAANFIKQAEPDLANQPQSDTIKNAFALYNGLPARYKQQAAALGFNPGTQGYEGSPYVMNMADAPRDPHIASVVSSGNWEQDRGGGNYSPATIDQYGAFVMFASVSGVTLGGGCSTGSIDCSPSDTNPTKSGQGNIRQRIVCITEAELALWNSGKLKAGTDFYKYSENRPELWCADFVSWVYNQAGYPLGPAGSPSNNWNISYVGSLLTPPQDKSKFTFHSSRGYKPQPGDMAIHSTPDNLYYHVNLVDNVSPGKILLIGGDQHGSGGFNGNVVNTETISSPSDDNIIGYVGPN